MVMVRVYGLVLRLRLGRGKKNLRCVEEERLNSCFRNRGLYIPR